MVCCHASVVSFSLIKKKKISEEDGTHLWASYKILPIGLEQHKLEVSIDAYPVQDQHLSLVIHFQPVSVNKQLSVNLIIS